MTTRRMHLHIYKQAIFYILERENMKIILILTLTHFCIYIYIIAIKSTASLTAVYCRVRCAAANMT